MLAESEKNITGVKALKAKAGIIHVEIVEGSCNHEWELNVCVLVSLQAA